MADSLRIPPYSAEAERGVIGSILLDPLASLHKTLDSGLTASAFYDRRHQALFEQIDEMSKTNVAMDALTIGQWLKDNDALDKVGGYEYLIELQGAVLVPAHVGHYCSIVMDKKRYRLLIERASETIDAAYKSTESPIDLSMKMISDCEQISNAAHISDRSTQEIASTAFENDEAVAAGKTMGLPFPWTNFQYQTFGIPERAMCPIFGRDGRCKSRLITWLSLFWAESGRHGLYFPFEDGAERFISNIASGIGGYDMFDVRRGKTDHMFMENHKQCLDKAGKLPIHIEDCPCTIERIVSMIATYKRKYNIEYVVIDGLKDIILTEGENQTTKENYVCANIVRACKRYDVTIIPVLHMTKLEEGKWIQAMHMKGSGTFHQSARFVMALQDSGIPEHIKAKYNNELKNFIVLEAEKTSYGTKSVVVLKPDLEHGGFTEITAMNAMAQSSPAEPQQGESDGLDAF